jgi:hypothetical protein
MAEVAEARAMTEKVERLVAKVLTKHVLLYGKFYNTKTFSGALKVIAMRTNLELGAVQRVFKELQILARSKLIETGEFVIPGLARLRTKQKAASKAGKRMMFGKEFNVPEKPARKVVKASAVAGAHRRLQVALKAWDKQDKQVFPEVGVLPLLVMLGGIDLD